MEDIIINGKSYSIIKLLGHGKSGYSYLAEDSRQKYVLKQIHHEPCSYYQFGNKMEAEIRSYERLSKIGIPMPAWITADTEKEIIVKEFIDGETIYDLIRTDKMKNSYVQQIKEMCGLLYPANTNIDYFPTNFVVQKDLIYYIDYECNDYMEAWDFENWGIKYWSKTPEFSAYVKEQEEVLPVKKG